MALLDVISGGLAGRLVGALPVRVGQQALPIEIEPGQKVVAKVTIRNAGGPGEISVWTSRSGCFSDIAAQKAFFESGETKSFNFTFDLWKTCAGQDINVEWHASGPGGQGYKRLNHYPAFRMKALPVPPVPEFVVEYTPA